MGEKHQGWYDPYLSRNGKGRAAYRDQLARWIASGLAAIPSGERQDITRRANALVGSEDFAYAMPFLSIPPGAPMELAAKVAAGENALLEGLLQATPDQTVGQIIRTANSIATGAPIGGDPQAAQLLPSAAAVLLDAGLRKGAPQLEDPEVVEALIAIDQLYDCARHQLPLGGGILDGLKAWWKGNFGSDADKIQYQQAKQAKTEEEVAAANELARNKAITKLVKQGYSVADATAMVDASQEASAATGTVPDATPVLDAAVNDTVTKAATAATKSLSDVVANAREAMKESAQKLQSQKNTAEAAALKLARLKWAEAALEAPDDVAKLMTDARPDWTSQGAALQTAVDLLAAAKESGDVPTLKVFSRLLGGLRKSKGDTASWIETLLGGDPAAFYARLEAPEDERAAEGLAEFLRAKSLIEDPFSTAPPELKKEVLEL